MGGLEVRELLRAKWPTQGSDEARQVADGFLFSWLCAGGLEPEPKHEKKDLRHRPLPPRPVGSYIPRLRGPPQ